LPGARAWSLISIASGAQHAGNHGYEDDPGRVYRYDSYVANSQQLRRGDLVVVRDRTRMLGIARVERIEERDGQKTMLRCPQCHSSALKKRAKRQPPFRCNEGHEFPAPLQETVAVRSYAAHFGGSFVGTPEGVPVSMLKASAIRPSDQLSIEEIDTARLEPALLSAFPDTWSVLASFHQAETLEAGQGDPPPIPDAGSLQPYEGSPGDARERVLRAIRSRRGQQDFRKVMLQRYGGCCAVTGCAVPDVLEAAHVWPYRGVEDHHPDNGLLLRADIHTLFDLDLLGIEPETLTVALAPGLLGHDPYGALQGKRLGPPDVRPPARAGLLYRWQSFREKWPAASEDSAGRP
jgi:hypothetical protein